MQKNTPSYRKTILGLSALSLALGLFSFVFDLALPFAVGALAVLFLLENPKKRVFSYIVSGALVGAEIGFSLFGLAYCAYAPLIIIPALLLAVAFRFEWIRRDASVALILAIAALMLITVYFSGAGQIHSYAFSDVVAHYRVSLDVVKEEFVASMRSAFEEYAGASKLSEEGKAQFLAYPDAIATSVFELLFAIFAWVAMIFEKIAVFVFSAGVKKLTKIEKTPFFSDFITTSLTAYVFFILLVIEAFSGASHTVFAVAVRNLSMILVLPYAYIGLKGIFTICKRSGRVGLRLIVILAIVFFSIYAIRIVAYFGAFSNIMFNRAIREFSERDGTGHE